MNQSNNKKIITTTVTQQSAPQGQRKTGKNRNRRRRRQNKNVTAQVVAQVLKKASLYSNPSAAMSVIDQDIAQDTNKVLQSLFFPHKGGIHRSVSSGSNLTSLAFFKGSANLTFQSASADNTASFSFVPAYFSTSTANTTAMLSIVKGPAVVNPRLALTAGYTTAVGVAHPFTTTVGATARIVHASLTLYPEARGLDRNADGLWAYDQLATISGGFATTGWTRAEMDQLEATQVIDGTKAIIYNWFPAEDEYDLRPMAQWTSGTADLSGLRGYLTADVGVSTSYRIEYHIGVEYTPTVAYRPYVPRALPTGHPDTWYYMNRYLGRTGYALVLAERNEYLKAVDEFTSSIPGWDVLHYVPGGSTGPQLHVDLMEEEKQPSTMQRIRNAACKTIEQVTGKDYCDPNVAFKQATRYATQGYTPYVGASRDSFEAIGQ